MSIKLRAFGPLAPRQVIMHRFTKSYHLVTMNEHIYY